MTIFIEDRGLGENKAVGDWNFVTKKERAPFRGNSSRAQKSEGLVQHILELGKEYVPEKKEVFFGYVSTSIPRIRRRR